ncbi:MAG: triose-phosphate isomerase [Candidatus Saccharimonadales bacterium]
MSQKKKLIIGNWKMNLNTHEASLYLHKLQDALQVRRDVEVVVAPTTLTLQSMSLQIDRHKVKLAAQNFYWRDFGAYTGEVSATQLRGIVDYGLIGHSERRHVFGERNSEMRHKVQAALRNNIRPVLCIGETIHERTAGETDAIIHDQLVAGVANVTSEEIADVVIAYEPVWAIGTGDNATPKDVAAAIRTIRSNVAHMYGKTASEAVHVLYGGSVTANSAADYLATPGVDGLLVGGASLKLHEFIDITKKAHKEK